MPSQQYIAIQQGSLVALEIGHLAQSAGMPLYKIESPTRVAS